MPSPPSPMSAATSASPGWWAGGLSSRGQLWLAFLLLGAFKLALATRHVPWMDEMQALLIAREIGSVSDLYWSLRYEGHPPLWYLLIRVATLVHDSPVALTALAFVLSMSTAALLLFASPFPPAARMALALSYPLLFEYGFIARSYSATVFVVCAVAALRHKRVAWVGICLLSWLSAQAALIGLVLAALLWRGGNRSVIGAVGLVAGIGCVAWFVSPPADFASANAVGGEPLSLDSIAGLLPLFGSLVVTGMVDGIPPSWANLTQEPMLNTVGTTIVVLAVLGLFRRDWLALGLIAAFVGATAALHVFVYLLNVRHVGLVSVLVLACAWMLWRPSMGEVRAARVWLVLQVGFGLLFGIGALIKPLAAGDVVTAAVLANETEPLPVIAQPTFVGVEFAARTGRRTVNLEQECLASFQVWRKPSGFSPDRFAERAEAVAAASGGRAWLLTTKASAETYGSRLGARIRPIAGSEDVMTVGLHLFLIETDRRTPPLSQPDCSTRPAPDLRQQ